MASPNDGLRLPPPWISPAAGKPDREVQDVITVERREVVAGGGILGDFAPLGQTSRAWIGMTTLGNNVYATVNGGDIYKASLI